MRETKKFQKKKENFKCENCGAHVEGSGYTNHCPKCLYSKHVDVNPGDRNESCKGLMKPLGAIYSSGLYTIQQQCEKCGKKFKVKASLNDDAELLIQLTTHVFYD